MLAGLDYLEAQGLVDKQRAAIMGWSLGGVEAIFAASKAPERFDGVTDQAGGFETLDIITDELIAAGKKISAPLLIQHAVNDGLVPVDTSRRLMEPCRLRANPCNIRNSRRWCGAASILAAR